MTIALGMLHGSGVLISADTLVVTDTLGHHQSKIQGYLIDDGEIIFALAGNVPLAESTLQGFEKILLPPKKTETPYHVRPLHNCKRALGQ